MRVVDAGVVVELVAGDLDPDQLGDEELAAPHLIDSEVVNALRRLAYRGQLSDWQAAAALEGFLALILVRYPADWLRSRMWALRHNVSAYDATYLALAEATEATALLTTDVGLASAPGVRCRVEVVPASAP